MPYSKFQIISTLTKKAIWLCLLHIPFISSYSTVAAQTEFDTDNNAADFHPFETRDQNLFNLIHGQALPTSANLSEQNQGLWSSSLIITNTTNIEKTNEESITLDYEAYRFNLSYQYGLNNNWNLKFDIPLIYQTGGTFDSAIENWHEFFNLPNGQRPRVKQDQYVVQYELQTQTLINLNESNTSLGDIQIAAARSLIKNQDTSLSLWTSIKLPTGDDSKISGSGAVDFSTWLAMNRRLTKDWLLNLNAGAVILGGDDYQGIPVSDYALYGHITLGWLITDNISLKVQLQGHTSYYDKSQLDILGDTYLLNFGTSVSLNDCQQLDVAIGEDIKVGSSPDISLLINWRHFSHC